MNLFKFRLRDLRREHNLSGKDLASALGTTLFSISNWETGKNVPSIDMLITISRYFDCSLDYLLGTSDIKCCSPFASKIHSTDRLDDEQVKEVNDFIDFLAQKDSIN